MAVESSIENKICKVCGADVRLGSMFCYGCGSAVSLGAIAGDGKANGEVKKADTPTMNKAIAKPDAEINKPIEKPLAEPVTVKAAIKADQAEAQTRHLVVEKETTLKTAAAVRRQAKPTAKKNVEVVWEQAESSPNVLFLLAALVLIAFAVGALMAMLYLR